MRQDAAGNWIRHGAWQRYSSGGQLIETGHYANGQRTGRWTKWLHANEARDLAAGDEGFALPLVSQAEFQADQLHGQWMVFDAEGRRVLSVELAAGRRHGRFTRWDSCSVCLVRQQYEHGLPEGPRMSHVAQTGDLVATAEYLGGYRVVASDSGAGAANALPRTAGTLLVGPETAVTADDFTASRPAQYATGREVLRHGIWRSWSANGQLSMQGAYERGQPQGLFEWRHANGQLAAAGRYDAGRPVGAWQWWDAAGVQIGHNQDNPTQAVEVAAGSRMSSRQRR